MRRLSVVALVSVLVALAMAAIDMPPAKSGAHIDVLATYETVLLDVPPRLMWGWGPGLHGYCGSFSFQSFMLLWGNYVTAEEIRHASDSEELLVAVNAHTAADALKITYHKWAWDQEDSPQGPKLMAWAANHIDKGHGVVGTFYEQLKSGGDPDYDHIMPIFGYRRSKAENLVRSGADRNDVLGIYYNDLFRDYSLFGGNNDSFIRSRNQCKPPGATPSEAPYDFCLPKEIDYAIALTGIVDENGETYPTKLIMPSWTEPDWGKEDARHQEITNFTVTVQVSGLQGGVEYSLLRYDHKDRLPTKDFIRGAYSKRWNFVAGGAFHEFHKFDSFSSDSTIFYRTVVNA